MPEVTERFKEIIALCNCAADLNEQHLHTESVEYYERSLNALASIKDNIKQDYLAKAAQDLYNTIVHLVTDITKPKHKQQEPTQVKVLAATDAAPQEIELSAPASDVTFNDVIGLEDAKQAIREAFIIPKLYPHLFANKKRKPLSSLLLFGPPGTGKSMLAQAAANEIKASFMKLTPADILSSYYGESEKTIRKVFATARSKAPTLLFIDEVDSLFRRRNAQEDESSRRVKTTLMQEMSQRNEGVFILCCTNTPHDLDAAFTRRLQKRVYVPLPDDNGRKQILCSMIDGVVKSLDEPAFVFLASQTQGYSGSDLDVVVGDALMTPIREAECATHVKKVIVRGDKNEEVVKYRPCKPNEPGSIDVVTASQALGKNRIPPDLLYIRDVCFEDFLHAIRSNPPSVSAEDIKEFANLL